MLSLAYKLKAEIDSPLGKSTEFALSASCAQFRVLFGNLWQTKFEKRMPPSLFLSFLEINTGLFSVLKVQIFWEGNQILKKISQFFNITLGIFFQNYLALLEYLNFNIERNVHYYLTFEKKASKLLDKVWKF